LNSPDPVFGLNRHPSNAGFADDEIITAQRPACLTLLSL
jgi:hypothetical protein